MWQSTESAACVHVCKSLGLRAKMILIKTELRFTTAVLRVMGINVKYESRFRKNQFPFMGIFRYRPQPHWQNYYFPSSWCSAEQYASSFFFSKLLQLPVFFYFNYMFSK